ncbi:hypothetical protein SESBI_47739, partial [Sesbania bispinosa]
MGISDEMKISRAMETMRGRELDWWFCWRWSNQNATWWAFVKAVLKQFQPEYDPDLLTASSRDEEQESDLEFETLMPLEESQEPVAWRTGTDKENEQELREPETTQEGATHFHQHKLTNILDQEQRKNEAANMENKNHYSGEEVDLNELE